MAFGKPKHEEPSACVASTDLPTSPGLHFCQKLNRLLGEAKFDEYVVGLCRPYYAAKLGRLRSEYTERSFAHERYPMYVAARNLGVMMRALFKLVTPKSLQTEGELSPSGGEASCRAALVWLAIVPIRPPRSSGSSVPSPACAINRRAFTQVHYAA